MFYLHQGLSLIRIKCSFSWLSKTKTVQKLRAGVLTRNGEKSVQQGKTEDEQERIKLSLVCQGQLISIFFICVVADRELS